jgi:branched-subunit amino acid ABC-type transport system permease component
MTLVLNSLSSIAQLVLVVTGLMMIFGLLGIVNLAHTGLMTIGVYIAISIREHGGNFVLAVIGGTIAAGIIGAVVEVLIIRRLYGRPLDSILATWGVSLVIIEAITLTYGPGLQDMALPIHGGVTIFGTTIATYPLVLVLVAIVLLAALVAVAVGTRAGKVVRMVLDNPELARTNGINTGRVRQLAFVAGSALAGMAGALLGPTQAVQPNYASGILVVAFLAVLLAGRSLAGLVIACVVLGTVQTVFTLHVDPTYATIAVIVLGALILRVRSNGFELKAI